MNQPTINCNCPHCQQIDQVQKISAIYSAGLSTSDVTGHLDTDLIGTKVKLKGQNQTELSKRFKPPEKPKETITNEQVLGCAGVVVISSAILTIFFLIINSVLFVVTGIIFGYVSIAFIIVFPIWWVRYRRMPKPPSLQKRLSHWQELCNIWNGTYYCHRCNIVYHPNKPDHVYSVENASQLYNFQIGS